MKIETEFELGYEFWVPRVRWDYSKESIEVNGETYYREIKKLVEYAKPKTLVVIDVSCSLDEPTTIQYWTCNGHGDLIDKDGLHSLCYPHDMKYTDEKSAREFAEKYLLIKGQPYYGQAHDL